MTITKGINKVISPTTISVIVATVTVGILLGIFAPQFYSMNNILNILEQMSTVGIMAAGASFVLVGGGMDISLSANLCCSAIIGCIVMRDTQNVAAGLAVMFAMSMVVGCLNGVAASYFRMVPFIVTMSTMVIAQGLGTKLSKSKGVYGIPESFVNAVTSRVLGVPIPILVLLLFTAVYWLILNKSALGRMIFAVGSNENAALVCGINTNKIKMITYMLSAFSAFTAGAILTARLGTASMQMASDTTNMDVMCSAIIGGVSVYGGKGNIWGAFIGTCFIISFSNVVNLTGISYFPSLIIKGLVIILIVFWDAQKAREQGRT